MAVTRKYTFVLFLFTHTHSKKRYTHRKRERKSIHAKNYFQKKEEEDLHNREEEEGEKRRKTTNLYGIDVYYLLCLNCSLNYKRREKKTSEREILCFEIARHA